MPKVIAIDSNKPRRILDIVQSHNGEQILIWTQYDEEGEILHRLIPGSIHLTGKTKQQDRLDILENFRNGKIQILISKPRLLGTGLNLQFLSVCIFSWSKDSFEEFYQAVGRLQRYGQTKQVKIYIPFTDLEAPMLQNVMRKQKDYLDDSAYQEKLYVESLLDELNAFSDSTQTASDTSQAEEFMPEISTPKYRLIHGDCIPVMAKLEPNQFDLAVFSPPFADLYSYTDKHQDLGNCNSLDDEFELHFTFFAHHLYQVMKPGCVVAMHIAPLAILKSVKGYMGIRDFPSECRQVFENVGFIYEGKATIGKNPQALRNGTLVLIPNGWKAIENMHVGDHVIGSNGLPTKVIGVFHHAKREIYRVHFSDGSTIDCDGNHLWTVKTYGQNKNKWMNKTTRELHSFGSIRNSGSPKYIIPIVSNAIDFKRDIPLLVDPYLLGSLLGDGCISQDRVVEITTDREIIKKINLPELHSFTYRKNSDRANGDVARFAIVCEDWHRNDILNGLRQYGLQGKCAQEKFIPIDYLFSSIEDRKKLLSGLMDTDGSTHHKGRIKYNTTSEQLAKDITFLVQSLGGVVHSRIYSGGRYIHNNEDRFGRPCYDLTIRIDWCPFTLNRKVEKWKKHTKSYLRSIRKIELLNDIDDCTCITVDAVDGLYLTENCIVTHNSQAIRTKAHALLFKTLKKNSRINRFAIPDYMMKFVKPGTATPLPNTDVTNEEWIKFASPVWDWVDESDTLNNRTKYLSDGDTKHVCPLQLPVIDAAVRLWSARGEHVFSPFMGIGSEGVVAMRNGRKFTGVELKNEYFKLAHKNIEYELGTSSAQINMFHTQQKGE